MTRPGAGGGSPARGEPVGKRASSVRVAMARSVLATRAGVRTDVKALTVSRSPIKSALVPRTVRRH